MTGKRDLYTALALIAFGLVVFFEAWRMPRFEAIGGTLATAPGLVPGLLALIIAAFGLLMLVRTLRKRAIVHLAEGEVAADEGGTRRLLIMLVLSVGYAGFLVGAIPFWLATLLYVFATITVFELRPGLSGNARTRLLAIALLEAIVVAVAVPLLFEEVFLVNLP